MVITARNDVDVPLLDVKINCRVLFKINETERVQYAKDFTLVPILISASPTVVSSDNWTVTFKADFNSS